MDWQNNTAAVWRPNKQQFRAIQQIDPISLSELIGIDKQKNDLISNTERFIANKPCNNALLWGARGTGKSSLVKAVFNEYKDQGLRVVEVFKQDLHFMHDIVDQIRDQPFHFIIYCDDFSFATDDHSYHSLKTILEGSLEASPDNVLLYATSNRRHLVPQTMQDNLQSNVIDGELHLSDAIEEKISLSDRFGLWLSFHPITQTQYLRIIDSLFPNINDRSALHQQALLFSRERASRSGRTARQFYNRFVNTND